MKFRHTDLQARRPHEGMNARTVTVLPFPLISRSDPANTIGAVEKDRLREDLSLVHSAGLAGWEDLSG
jgi:hypothetical protein